MSATAQYDDIRKEYVALAATEPSKQFVQYPEILRLLGDVKGRKILDVGCGPGLLTRLIAARGAEVTAYDNSAEQIQLALDEENVHPLGIRYLIADASSIEKESGLPEAYFDSAISTLVLHYAKDLDELGQFFSSTFKLLKEGSRFITIVCNPDYTKMDQRAYNRVFHRIEGKKMTADFLDPDGTLKFTATFSDFSRAEYEAAARNAGFGKTEWLGLHITQEGREKMGPEFWNDFEEDCPYITFIATK